tara:strand:- start:286 stop:1614 length:1329 start_codon:yes stop_codon:yes gene_type:complete
MSYFRFSANTMRGLPLSNSAELEVKLTKPDTDGENLFKSGEHAFYGSKYIIASQASTNEKKKQKLIDYANGFIGTDTLYDTPAKARKAGGTSKMPLTQKERNIWDENSIRIQREIIEYKYKNYSQVRDILEKNKNKTLVHINNTKKENQWSAKIDKEGKIIGKNLLGVMWKETYDKFSKDPEPSPSPEAKEEPSPPPEAKPEKALIPDNVEESLPVEMPKLATQTEEPEPPVDPEPEPPADPEPEPPADPEPEPEKPVLEVGEEINIDKKAPAKKTSIYSREIITKKIVLHIGEIGKNITQIIEKKTKLNYENSCSVDGYIKKDSINIITYSSGNIENGNIEYNVMFECSIFKPVEGMIIFNCIVNNTSRAGIKASTNETLSPAVIFIAKDHSYNNDYFNSVQEGDSINVKIIGFRYELKDAKISIIGSLVNKKRNIKLRLL